MTTTIEPAPCAVTAPLVSVPVHYRAWNRPTPESEPEQGAVQGRRGRSATGRDSRTAVQWTLTVDTETRTDPSQALTFGSYRWAYRYGTKAVVTLEEGVFYADELAVTDPDGFATLRRYAAAHRADVSPKSYVVTKPSKSARGERQFVNTKLMFESRAEFVERVLWRAMKCGAVIVGFNLPFDLSRLAIDGGAGRGDNYGKFSLKVWPLDGYRPRILIQHLDSKKSLISTGSFSADARPAGWRGGRFLDCRTLAASLTGGEGFSLKSACEKWNVDHPKTTAAEHGVITDDYIAYNRRDVLATQELCAELLNAFYAYGLPTLAPERALSSASLAKHTLTALGVVGPLERNPDFPDSALGAACEAFYGGRSEVRIRRTHVPAEVHDLTSCYPTVNTLMGLWRFLTADTITVADATDDVRRLLNTVTVADCYRPETWPQFVGMVQIIPDGDVLPVRATYAPSEPPVIGHNPLYSDRPTWYTIADCVASALLTGKPPTVIRAIRLISHGTASGLTPFTLGSIAVNPITDDLFKLVIEKRKAPDTDPSTALFLKILANAGSYGIFSEFVVHKNPVDKTTGVSVWAGDDTFETRVADVETAGTFCFPPIAACITGASRLMLTLLQIAITDEGGSWAFCDTDSMAIVCDGEGSLIECRGGPHVNENGIECVRALTPKQTARIRERFDTALNPYDRSIVPTLLKREYSATVYAVAAKRYATYVIEHGRIVAPTVGGKRGSLGKQHGLGHLRSPKVLIDDPDEPQDSRDHSAWTDDVWRFIIARDLISHQPGSIADDSPDLLLGWDDLSAVHRPATMNLSVTSPHVLSRFDSYNEGRPWADRIKPFNFLMAVQRSTYGSTGGQLLAPYDSDLTHLDDGRLFTDYSNPNQQVSIVLDGPRGIDWSELSPDKSLVANLQHTINHHDDKPENKYLDPHADVRCAPHSRGLLRLTPTTPAFLSFIGKEVRDFHAVEQPGIESPDVGTFGEIGDEWTAALRTLQCIGQAEIRERLRLTEATVTDRQLRNILDGTTGRPRDPLRTVLVRISRVHNEDEIWDAQNAIPGSG